MKSTEEGFITVPKFEGHCFSTEVYYQPPIIVDYDDEINEALYGIRPKTPVVIPPLIPMGNFVAKLIETKSETEVAVICDKYNLPKRYDIPNEKELLFEAGMVSALMQIYAVCLPIARGKSKKSDTANLYDLLYYARRSYRQMLKLMLQKSKQYNTTNDPDTKDIIFRNCLTYLPQLPLIEHFDDFDRDRGSRLQKRFGYEFKKVRRRGEESPPRARFFFWDNPSVSKVARDALWNYTANNRPQDATYILHWDPRGLASRYLAILDEYIEHQIKQVQFQFDSSSGTAKLIINNLHSALYLWVFNQIQAKKEYRICKMCGRLFVVGSQPEKKYCNLHEKYEISYYTRIIEQVRKGITVDDMPEDVEEAWYEDESHFINSV